MTGPGTMLGSSFVQGVDTGGSPCAKSCCSCYKMCPSVRVHVGQCVPMYKESRHALMQALPEDENKEKKFFFGLLV